MKHCIVKMLKSFQKTHQGFTKHLKFKSTIQHRVYLFAIVKMTNNNFAVSNVNITKRDCNNNNKNFSGIKA